MKKFKILKIIFIYVVVTSLILFLSASLTSCCNISYVIDKLNELRNKTITGSYNTTTSDTQELSTSTQYTSDSITLDSSGDP